MSDKQNIHQKLRETYKMLQKDGSFITSHKEIIEKTFNEALNYAQENNYEDVDKILELSGSIEDLLERDEIDNPFNKFGYKVEENYLKLKTNKLFRVEGAYLSELNTDSHIQKDKGYYFRELGLTYVMNLPNGKKIHIDFNDNPDGKFILITGENISFYSGVVFPEEKVVKNIFSEIEYYKLITKACDNDKNVDIDFFEELIKNGLKYKELEPIYQRSNLGQRLNSAFSSANASLIIYKHELKSQKLQW